MSVKKSKPRKRKRVRRIVLGVGHPWFLRGSCMYRTLVSLGRDGGDPGDVELKFGNLGNWNRIRLVAEVLS